MIAHDRLKSVLTYEAGTGEFRWRVKMGSRARQGARAGTVKADGYRIIFIERKRYSAHRLAWFYVHGRWPLRYLDHANGERDDNRIANLREATKSQNAANSRAKVPGSVGLRGVSRVSGAATFQSRVSFEGQEHYLGTFRSPQAAHAAYRETSKRLHGEFARTE